MGEAAAPEQSYEEIQHGDPYYDLDLKRIGTMAHVVDRTEGGQNTRKFWIAGLFFSGQLLAEIDTDKWCFDNEYAAVSLRVEDNGTDGDGLWLDAEIVNGVDSSVQELFAVRLSPRQATTLARALLCAVAMRGGEPCAK